MARKINIEIEWLSSAMQALAIINYPLQPIMKASSTKNDRLLVFIALFRL